MLKADKKEEIKPVCKKQEHNSESVTESINNKSDIKQNKESVDRKGIADLTVIGQLNNAFILAQNEEGLYIIDQHTCHGNSQGAQHHDTSVKLLSKAKPAPCHLIYCGN